MNKIPNELARQFNTVAGRKKLIELYADSKTMFSGVNEDGESVTLSVSAEGIVLNTYQQNGWVRVNYYDANGVDDGETFDGKWKRNLDDPDLGYVPTVSRVSSGKRQRAK